MNARCEGLFWPGKAREGMQKMQQPTPTKNGKTDRFKESGINHATDAKIS
jgi:hypothetical protein